MTAVVDLKPRRPASGPPDTVYRCGAAARWLPRVLAASWLVAGLLVAEGFDTAQALPFARGVQLTVLVAGGVLGVWTLRGGSEVRVRVTVSQARVLLAWGTRETGVEFSGIERFASDVPLAASRHLFPATVIRSDTGGEWRLPAVLIDGDRAVREIVERSGRDDLRTWMETLNLERRMGRAGLIVGLGYAFAAAIVASALVFYST